MPPAKRAKKSSGSPAKPAAGSEVLKFYRQQVEDPTAVAALEASLLAQSVKLVSIQLEHCYNVQLKADSPPLSEDDCERLKWLIAETYEPENVGDKSLLPHTGSRSSTGVVLEVGPRLSFATAFSSNAVSICSSCGLEMIARVELSRRFLVQTQPKMTLAKLAEGHAKAIHDPMTECVYFQPLDSFASQGAAEAVKTVPVLSGGREALKKCSDEMGLGFDEDDLDMYTKLFVDHLGRDPTDVECFDMGQSNSEHSRHWFFGGIIMVDGKAKPQSLFSLVKSTLKAPACNPNSIIAFKDNSSAIEGATVTCMTAAKPDQPAAFATKTELRHPILTAETHNFPCGIAPFPGAETGTGGRIRDVQATGRGAFVVAGVSAYCMGRLQIPGYSLPWEEDDPDEKPMPFASNLAPPLQIQTAASNGASDYGNKFGEPVIVGFNRSFGLRLPNGERREWLKPIMFSAGLGAMPGCLAKKGDPEPGMWVVKVGGPAYRIGLGGGAASSKAGGESSGPSAADFNAVQRGDAEMENRMNRVIRACAELGDANPIVSIHDQGAGGNGNVLKEIVEPLGAKLQVRSIVSGDPTLSVLELWGAEYQENCALLLRPESLDLFKAICEREHCPASFVGQVTGDGRVVLEDSETPGSTPFDLPLSLVLADMPRKTFESTSPQIKTIPLKIPAGTTVASALDRVLRNPSVASKRFLTNKVDRSVTGLIAQQQCVGPLHTPLADVGVVAHTHNDVVGAATAVGEQPIKGLVSPAAMARLSVAESLTNLVWAPITSLGDVKCSANWMWAAKLEGEAAAMYEACEAMVHFMAPLGVSVDGGKDSLSMAAKAGGETVKAPGALVITVYATCPDVRLVVTPDLKGGSAGSLSQIYLLDMSGGRRRLGGSALAHCYKQLGDEVPDVDDPALLKRGFEATQKLIKESVLLSGHDVSDGGLLTAVLEMAFAGNIGIDVDLPAALAADSGSSMLGALAAAFAEEIMLVVEVEGGAAEAELKRTMAAANVPCIHLGRTRLPSEPKRCHVSIGGAPVLDEQLVELRDTWEATSVELEKRQCHRGCVAQEASSLARRHEPSWHLSFTPAPGKAPSSPQAVAVVRQEGSNGDREMAAALMAAGLAPWDVAMSDLVAGKLTLDRFRGIVFVGGFSYADVLGSAKGWAAVLKFNAPLWAQLVAFRAKPNTFSLGVCNGCQLMALLGWVPTNSSEELLPALDQPRFIHNTSGRFESRFSSVTIQPSPAVLLKGMEGSSMGVWVAHGEGKAHFPNPKILDTVLEKNLAPIRYVDDDDKVTTAYPFCPNGSAEGIAALCSEDGRHLAMMPHPERCFLPWQHPWMPKEWSAKDTALQAGPWLKLFQNAAAFCDETA